MDFEMVIGLEVHAQLLTKTKLFCSCISKFGDKPNTHGCPVCLGLPGSLPVLNSDAVTMAVKAGLALKCSIARQSFFERKNYFYPDLPKGYQISQYEIPLCSKGTLTLNINGSNKEIGINRIHLEEDAGKLIHDQAPDSLLDINRCGTPLIEIVSEPDMHSSQEAYAYLESLKLILEYLQICDCNMEEGSLRCDANISLRASGQSKLGTKTEIKNMNSFHNLVKALDYESNRQATLLSSGGKVLQETFLWNPDSARTILMRSKENADDYRYFPDPDLLPLIITDEKMETIRRTLPVLPSEKKSYFVKQLGLADECASVLISDRSIADYFEKVIQTGCNVRLAANWVLVNVLRIVKNGKCAVTDLKVTPSRLGELILLIDNGSISAKAARKVFDLIQTQDKEPSVIIDEQGLSQMQDQATVEAEVRKVLDANPSQVKLYQSGEKKLKAFFIGQIMKATGECVNPGEINSILSKLIG